MGVNKNDDPLAVAASLVALGVSARIASQLLDVKQEDLKRYIAAIQTTSDAAEGQKDVANAAVSGVHATLAAILERSQSFYDSVMEGDFSTREVHRAVKTLKRIHRLPNTIDYETKQAAISLLVRALTEISERYVDRVPIDTLTLIAEALHKYAPKVVFDEDRPPQQIRIKFRRTFNRTEPVLNERGKRLLAMWRAAMQGNSLS